MRRYMIFIDTDKRAWQAAFITLDTFDLALKQVLQYYNKQMKLAGLIYIRSV